MVWKVFYTIRAQELTVLAVIHGARDPMDLAQQLDWQQPGDQPERKDQRHT